MLGVELRQLRAERGMSKSALARLSGISRTQLYAIEDGESQRPYVETLIDLARGLSTQADGTVDDALWGDAFQRLQVAAGYLKEASTVLREVPDQLQARFNAIAQNWSRWDHTEREHAARLLDVVSHFGRAADTVAPDDSRTPEMKHSNNLALYLDWADPRRDMGAAAPSRELAFAGR